MKHAKRTLRKLNYLPRWAWYALSYFLFPPFGPVVVYLVFHALTRAAQDEDADEDTQDWMRFATTYMHEHLEKVLADLLAVWFARLRFLQERVQVGKEFLPRGRRFPPRRITPGSRRMPPGRLPGRRKTPWPM